MMGKIERRSIRKWDMCMYMKNQNGEYELDENDEYRKIGCTMQYIQVDEVMMKWSTIEIFSSLEHLNNISLRVKTRSLLINNLHSVCRKSRLRYDLTCQQSKSI
jgi:hypothetical protein